MNQIALSQIEQNILSLPIQERLLLISRIAKKLSGKVETNSDFEKYLTEMSQDSDIQRELNVS